MRKLKYDVVNKPGRKPSGKVRHVIITALMMVVTIFLVVQLIIMEANLFLGSFSSFYNSSSSLLSPAPPAGTCTTDTDLSYNPWWKVEYGWFHGDFHETCAADDGGGLS